MYLGASGSTSDRRHAISAFAANYPQDPVDVIIGDWMSEYNMTSRGASKSAGDGEAFEPSFLEAIGPALNDIARYGIKVAVNAGASDTEGLARTLEGMIAERKLGLTVAWVSGDEVFDVLKKMQEQGTEIFTNIYTGESLKEWNFEPIYAQAYLGGLGIAAAFMRGADIVVCGRVSDASPVIGAAAWWHSWTREDHPHQLANAFVAGHLIECSTYVTGGNFSGFKALQDKKWDDLGFPIAEISGDGSVIITKQKDTGGMVSVDTCTSQLLYEIQGPVYLNSDVAAILDQISFEEIAPGRVALHGVQWGLPPPTTKVGVTARGGFQAEVHWFLVGLDIPAKARMAEEQFRKLLAPYSDKFSKLEFTINGSSPADPVDQNSATVDLRIFAQARNVDDLAPTKFLRPCIDPIMQSYPGATPHLDIRSGFPREFFEYYVTLLPQTQIRHQVHLASGEVVDIAPPSRTTVWPTQQPSQSITENPRPLDAFGPCVRGPLGWIVHARSGDKGSDCNVGFWVRMSDEWEWLRSVLNVETMTALLGKEFSGGQIVRAKSPQAPLSSVSLANCGTLGSLRTSESASSPLPATQSSRQRSELHEFIRLSREKRCGILARETRRHTGAVSR
jgi:hypothetical protein